MTADQILNLKNRHTIAIMLMVLLAFMISAIDIYIPAMPALTAYFDTSEFIMKFSVAINPISSCLFVITMGRLADIKGRRVILHTGIASIMLGSIICALSMDVYTFLLGRFVQSVGTTAISVICLTIITDLFRGIELARYIAVYAAIFPVVFAIAPIIGASLFEYLGWRANFTFLFLCNGLLLLYFWRYLPETLAVLKKGTQPVRFLKAARTILRKKDFLTFTLIHSLPISIVGIFVANGAFLFISGFEFTPQEFALAQAIPITLNFAAAIIYRQTISIIGLQGALRMGFVGFILFIIMLSAVLIDLLPCTPFMIIATMCIVNIAMPFLIATCSTKAIELAEKDKGLGIAIISLLRNLGLTIAMLLSSYFADGSTSPIFMAMLIVSIIICTLILPHVLNVNENFEQKEI